MHKKKKKKKKMLSFKKEMVSALFLWRNGLFKVDAKKKNKQTNKKKSNFRHFESAPYNM